MKTKYIISIILLSIFTGLLITCTDPEPVGNIDGTVKDENGSPIESVTININPDEGEKTSDTNGKFTYTDISPLQYTLTITKEGFNDETKKVSVKDGQTESIVIILSIKTAIPKITTGNAKNITATSAEIEGVISNLGSDEVTAYGHCWSTYPAPITSDNNVDYGHLNELKTFTSSITNLQANTKYFIRAYATNSVGTAYSQEVNFTTEVGTAVISITNPTNIDYQTLTANGNIDDLGASNPTQYGFIWSKTNSNPTTANNEGKVELGSTIIPGSFMKNLTNFTAATNYYIRAFVTNSYGTAYSDVITFSTKSSFTDSRDGQTYNVVQIGNQIWMKENLNYKTANSWCYDNSSSNCATYSRLYSWDAANSAVPSGWHLPSNSEWKVLIDYLGGENIAGGKMKETGTNHWDSPNTGATNESGFTALPNGYRYTSGEFRYLSLYTNFWSSTTESSSNASRYHLSYQNTKFFLEDYSYKGWGFSVRCIKSN